MTVTFNLDSDHQTIQGKEIEDTFKESGILKNFKSLSQMEQKEIIKKILAQTSKEKQVQLLVHYIGLLGK